MKLGQYRHYRGQLYEVLGVVMHTETNEKLVLYRGISSIRHGRRGSVSAAA